MARSKVQDSRIFLYLFLGGLSLQSSLNELRCLDGSSTCDVYITRQEAADMLGKGLRQLDRDCIKYNIERKRCNNGIRISKRDIMRHMGYALGPGESSVESVTGDNATEFDRILRQYNRLKR